MGTAKIICFVAGSRQKWVPLDIDPPKSDRRQRRSRSQGRGPMSPSAARRDARRPADRLVRGDKRDGRIQLYVNTKLQLFKSFNSLCIKSILELGGTEIF